MACHSRVVELSRILLPVDLFRRQQLIAYDGDVSLKSRMNQLTISFNSRYVHSQYVIDN